MAYRKCPHRLSETCHACEKDAWRAWREDYRSERPAVTCEGCGTHYPRGNQDTGNATYIGYALKTCGACHRHNELKRASARNLLKLHRHISARQNTKDGAIIKEVHRDIACRYIQRFDGSTFAVQTAADDAIIYLRNAFGLTIATVKPTDKFPKPVVIHDLPY